MELEQAIAELDQIRTAEQVALENEQHTQFLADFPRDAWADMTLDRYALGTGDNRTGYSYALEWGTPDLGSIRGGSARKHVIFFKRSSDEWRFPPQFTSVADAWDSLRAGFEALIKAGDEGAWEDTSEIDILRGANLVRLKTLYLYFPEAILPVYSRTHLIHFATQLKLEHDDDPILVNRRIFSHLRTFSGLESVSTSDLAHLLYTWSPPSSAHNPTSWKIAPGPNASEWSDCLAHGYICVGWDDVGDLSLFDSEEDFRLAFTEAYSAEYNAHQPTITRKARELWRLVQLEPGDKVVANKGKRQILAIGTVTEAGYEWKPERSDFKHTVAVDWDVTYAKELDEPVKQWGTATVLKVPKSLLARLTITEGSTTVKFTPSRTSRDIENEDKYREWERILDRKKQIIFYGPPGTGKTYAARSFAQWLLGERLNFEGSEGWTDEDLIGALTVRGTAENAWWVTADPMKWSWDNLFHAGYTDYRRGRIDRHYDSAQSGDVVVCYEGAPSSRIVGLARVVSVHSGEAEGIQPLRLIPIRRIEDGPTWKTMRENSTLRASEPIATLGRGTLFALRPQEFREILHLSGIEEEFLGRPANDLSAYLTELTFHASYSYEEFIEGYRPASSSDSGLRLALRDGVMKRVSRTAAADAPDPYILLIDELNRANVPRVFGELLTVIEADKRGTSVLLPASDDTLSIPENLYIIGTMNTADRSIRSLDAALRRRFAFIELLPDPSLLEGETVNEQLALDVFLDELNRRITKSAGRERQIGHSFFFHEGQIVTDPDDFAAVMRLEIIPLLQEIAYDDYGKLAEYLGSELVDSENQRLTTVADDPSTLISALASEYRAQPESVDP